MGNEPVIFEKGRAGRGERYLPHCDVPAGECGTGNGANLPERLRRKKPPRLPELTEGEAVRHYTRLSRLNYGVDTGVYPLGSCTMKYNPKLHEDAANLPGFTEIHPYQPEESVQGALALMYETERWLAALTGMDAFTLQPAAGAHGELTGLLMIMAYHASRGEHRRNKVIVPDSSHGTNPATAAMAGCTVVQIPSDRRGVVDLAALEKAAGEDTAALMLTNPNTLGLFERSIAEAAALVHQAGALLYCDGANMNAIMGYARPGDMGFDAVHLNLHKTFSTPHGGGGPGSGPVGVKSLLEPFLPRPIIVHDERRDYYRLDYERPASIGRVKSFYGNFGVIVKAYAYLKRMGADGLREASAKAVLNANYLMKLLAQAYHQPFDGPCKHEFVISPGNMKEYGVHTLDIAKRLIDFGFHPPTIYFPLIVPEALMIEPTETENKETLDAFAAALLEIAREIREEPQVVKEAPHNTPVGRLDETAAARNPVLRWRPEQREEQ